APVLIAAITAATAAEHPFSREAATTVRITALGPDGPCALGEPVVEVDRGKASYAFRLPGSGDAGGLLDDPAQGWGEAAGPGSPPAYAKVAAIPSATVVVRDGDRELGSFRWRDLRPDRPVEQAGLRVEDAELGRNWVHVTVLDDETGRPVPCRIALRSLAGIPYQPHGHPAHVNSDLGTWHVDIGGGGQPGRRPHAPVDGTRPGRPSPRGALGLPARRARA